MGPVFPIEARLRCSEFMRLTFLPVPKLKDAVSFCIDSETNHRSWRAKACSKCSRFLLWMSRTRS